MCVMYGWVGCVSHTVTFFWQGGFRVTDSSMVARTYMLLFFVAPRMVWLANCNAEHVSHIAGYAAPVTMLGGRMQMPKKRATLAWRRAHIIAASCTTVAGPARHRR